jgi:6-phosphofructokinase 1
MFVTQTKNLKQEHLIVADLGPRKFVSPVLQHRPKEWEDYRMTSDDDGIQVHIQVNPNKPVDTSLTFEKAGARDTVFFNGPDTKVAIVTCGGLCPGLNNVVRQLVLTLFHTYQVREIYGIRYGYAGMVSSSPHKPILLTPEMVEDIHKQGGTILASSRGKQNPVENVDFLEKMGVNILFAIGGDGTLRGATEIADVAEQRGTKLGIIGIPKTIDNDIPLVFKSFGFETAVEQADIVLNCAHAEAKGVPNGVGLVKLMGRHAGFIAAMATRASGDVNYCLVPEVPVVLDGPNGFLAHLYERLASRNHVVVVVAEGAFQDLMGVSGQHDKSGNPVFNDAGLFLKDKIQQYYKEKGEEVNVKYFDPSYMIRSVSANGHDAVFCSDLGRYAAHAGMTGKTCMFVGYWHGFFTHVPFNAIRARKRIMKPTSSLWRSVLTTTGQPVEWGR